MRSFSVSVARAFASLSCMGVLTPRARALRKRMTDAETVLWKRLRNRQLGHKFRRQEPIGRFIVDFVCYEKMLIIEADGAHHLNNKYDQERDAWLKAHGYLVLRFWNSDLLKNTEGVLEKINGVLLMR